MIGFGGLINELFTLNEVRYASVVTKDGARLAGGMKPGVESLDSDEENKLFEFRSSFAMEMVKASQQRYGNFDRCVLAWEKITVAYYLVGTDALLSVSMEGDMNFDAIKRVTETVRSWKLANPSM